MKKLRFVFVLLLLSLTRVSVYAQNGTSPDIQKLINDAYNMYKDNKEGKNADYIPFLARVDSTMFGIVVISTDGKIYKVGETKYEFGIESISKVFTLCMAMQHYGDTAIAKKIGTNATGAAFNSVAAIELEGKKPVNPFVNAGAMATTSLMTSLVTGDNQQKWASIADYYNKFAGRKLSVLQELYKSEAETNQHNRGIATLLQSYGYMYDDPLVACDVYTIQCSVGVNAGDLAEMAATLANGGTNPITKEKLIDANYVPRVLAIMATAGLYETSGFWMYKYGVPSKSCVGGGIITVIPGKYGIAVFAPPLDKAGNSVKAQMAIGYITSHLNANIYLPR